MSTLLNTSGGVSADVDMQGDVDVIVEAGGESWGSNWISEFTGIPITSESNPLGGIRDCFFRNIINVLGTYHLFEENTFGIAPFWTISKRTSSDGLHFPFKGVALLAAGGVGDFDEYGQADPTVIYDGVGDWKMWFDALTGGSVWDKLGYATSVDGATWNKVGSVLDRGAGGSWDDAWVHHPACVKYNGIYYLYYGGSQNAATNYEIGLATSLDGIAWTKYVGNPVLSYGVPGDWDSDYIRPSRPFIIFGTWYMLYWGYNGTNHSMGLATSPDGLTWTKQGKVLGNQIDYDQTDIEGSDNIVVNENNNIIIQIWYHVGSANGGLCSASISLPTGLTYLDKFTTTGITKYGDSTPASVFQVYGANQIYTHKFTIGANITPDAIKVFITNTGKQFAVGNIKCNIYNDVAGLPTTLIVDGETEEKEFSEVSGDEWTVFNFLANPTIIAGDYWIAIWSSVNYQRARGAGGGINWGLAASAYGAVWDDPIVMAGPNNFNDFDAHIIYTRDNVWDVALVTEPDDVYFNGKRGVKRSVIGDVVSEFDWFWVANVLYIYAETDPNLKYQISYE